MMMEKEKVEFDMHIEFINVRTGEITSVPVRVDDITGEVVAESKENFRLYCSLVMAGSERFGGMKVTTSEGELYFENPQPENRA